MTQQVNEGNKHNRQNNSAAIPDYARVVVVPIANPKTAPDLLMLAASLAHPDEGRIIALIVSTESLESEAEALEQLKEIVQKFETDGYDIHLRTETSTSISRGILDVVREAGGDLLVLGLRQPARGQVVLGTVVENVIETAPCDVLVYRAAHKSAFSRIVVPVDASLQSRVAARTAIRLAKSYGTRVEAIHVGDRNRGNTLIDQTLEGIPGEEMVRRSTITASNAASGILSRTGEDDLLLVGFSKRSNFERVVFGDIPGDMLNRAEGPVILVARALNQENTGVRLGRRILNWMRPALTRVEQEEVQRSAEVMAGTTIDYVTLILVSATIATLGLMLNSAAVIIGAMLVAPFMSPLIGLSVGVATGTLTLTRRGVLTIVVGILLSLLVAIGLGLLLPAVSLTNEMTSRGSPTLLDAGVALAAGIIGAYATARKDIPAALAGVAIAAALMPPLCTVGLGLALEANNLAFGALVLFLTNIVSIIVSGILVFRWLGMSARRADQPWTWQHTASISLFALFAAGVITALFGLTREANAQSRAIEELRKAIQPLELVEIEADDGDPLTIMATVRSAEPVTRARVGAVESAIESELGRDVRLEVVVLPVVTALEPLPEITAEPESTPEP